MSNIIVCGLVNMETTVPVESFPVDYCPVQYKFFGVTSHPSGVGLNIASALHALGDDVKLMTICGDDCVGDMVKSYLKKNGISADYVLEQANSTAQSVVLYDKDGKRSIYCDLTDLQELSFSEEVFRKGAESGNIAVLCNINFSRHLIPVAKEMGLLVATDVHCLSDINDSYNADYIKGADILFLSNENFCGREQEFVLKLMEVTDASVIVVGMGSKGALLYTKDTGAFETFPAVYTRKVVNTIGAGDSLFSSFLHFYGKTKDPRYSLKMATIFASYKIGDTSACRGFLSEDELIKLSESLGE